jgi:ABC-type dipeptide/oligopeptide/nickel transport system permease component
MPFLRRLAFAPLVFLAAAAVTYFALLLIILGLIADGVVSLVDPHVRMSSAQAW